ncbi:hypothetical protein D3C73_1121110 [compost metagenome]
MIRKISGHPQPLISKPPKVGPSAVPTADIVPSNPITLPVFSLGTASLANAIVNAIMTAAPKPWTARAPIKPIKPPSQGDAPLSADPTVNRTMPTSIRRRRPIKSPKRPTLTISVVMASKYANTTH